MKKVKYIFKQFIRPTAYWKWKLADNGWADMSCSKCGFTTNNDIQYSIGYPYCPNCGASMQNGCRKVLYENDDRVLEWKR